MRYQVLFLFIILSFLISCGGTTNTPKNSTPTPNVASNSNKSSTLGTNKEAEKPKVDDADSIKPTVDGFYEALKKKDEAGVKKYLSAAALKYYETEGKAEKKTWFAFLLESEDPVDAKREVRNEKISGDKATVEIKGGPLGNWTEISFVKENNEWKFASPRESIENIDLKRDNMPSNKSK
jgi:hypothetical protein